jgi:hypothetical protein
MKTIAWWLWATNGKSWDVMCGRLADLTESPAWGTHVYARMRTQRTFFAKGKLLQDRVARLKQIAWWQWGERRKNQNDVHFFGSLRER